MADQPQPESVITLGKEATAEYTEKKSVFIGCAAPVTDEDGALSLLARIRKAHPDARHHVYAYSLANGAVMRCSDDGEPQGTGGVPVLDIIRKSGVTGAAIVVTRYFGGILLGAGGLIRAYQTAAKRAVDEAGIVRLVPYTDFTLLCRYDDYPKLKHEFPKIGVLEQSADFAEAVRLTLTVRTDRYLSAAKRLSDMSAGRLCAEPCGSHLGHEDSLS